MVENKENHFITFLNSVPSWQVLNGLEAMGYKVCHNSKIKICRKNSEKNEVQGSSKFCLLEKVNKDSFFYEVKKMQELLSSVTVIEGSL